MWVLLDVLKDSYEDTLTIWVSKPIMRRSIEPGQVLLSIANMEFKENKKQHIDNESKELLALIEIPNGKYNQRFIKLLDAIYKEHQIKSVTSYKFIHDVMWKWSADTSTGKNLGPLSDYIIKRIAESVKEYKSYFPILNVRITHAFKIGDVEIGTFSRDYFDKYIETFKKNLPNEPNVFIQFKKMFGTMQFASCSAMAQREKAKELAFIKCGLAVDIIKICSETLDYPEQKLSFDIDSRVTQSLQSEVLIEAVNDLEGLTTTLSRPTEFYDLDEKAYNMMVTRGLETFSKFISTLPTPRTELQDLIVNSIQMFAKSLSNGHYGQRIAELFTIMESLLNRSNESPVMDSVTKYSSKLIVWRLEARKDFMTFIRKMYKARSTWIHHAKQPELNIEDLQHLQRIVHQLLFKLIEKSAIHSTKNGLLDEIDDAIIAAY